jgi:hypothetical protein
MNIYDLLSNSLRVTPFQQKQVDCSKQLWQLKLPFASQMSIKCQPVVFGGGSQSINRNPPTCWNSLTNLITYWCLRVHHNNPCLWRQTIFTVRIVIFLIKIMCCISNIIFIKMQNYVIFESRWQYITWLNLCNWYQQIWIQTTV